MQAEQHGLNEEGARQDHLRASRRGWDRGKRNGAGREPASGGFECIKRRTRMPLRASPAMLGLCTARLLPVTPPSILKSCPTWWVPSGSLMCSPISSTIPVRARVCVCGQGQHGVSSKAQHPHVQRPPPQPPHQSEVTALHGNMPMPWTGPQRGVGRPNAAHDVQGPPTRLTFPPRLHPRSPTRQAEAQVHAGV